MSSYKFIEWMDIDGTGMLSECAILKKFESGDIYFFPLASLDFIDKQRLHSIITGRNATMYTELWQLLEQHTLGNGSNALMYFNQLAKQRTVTGQVLPFGSGKLSGPQRPVSHAPIAGAASTTVNQPAPSFDAVAKPNSPAQAAKAQK
jgi:hypothetical protein